MNSEVVINNDPDGGVRVVITHTDGSKTLISARAKDSLLLKFFAAGREGEDDAPDAS